MLCKQLKTLYNLSNLDFLTLCYVCRNYVEPVIINEEISINEKHIAENIKQFEIEKFQLMIPLLNSLSKNTHQENKRTRIEDLDQNQTDNVENFSKKLVLDETVKIDKSISKHVFMNVINASKCEKNINNRTSLNGSFNVFEEKTCSFNSTVMSPKTQQIVSSPSSELGEKKNSLMSKQRPNRNEDENLLQHIPSDTNMVQMHGLHMNYGKSFFDFNDKNSRIPTCYSYLNKIDAENCYGLSTNLDEYKKRNATESTKSIISDYLLMSRRITTSGLLDALNFVSKFLQTFTSFMKDPPITIKKI